MGLVPMITMQGCKMEKVRILEVREMFPDGRASENIHSFFLPILRETATLYVTQRFFIHNIVSCTPRDTRAGVVSWAKEHGLRVGDIPCIYTPTFVIVGELKALPKKQKHHVHLGNILS